MAGSPRYVTALISALRLRNPSLSRCKLSTIQNGSNSYFWRSDALDDPPHEELRRLLSTLGALAH